MGYMEEVFQRAENKFSTLDAQIGWLSSFAQKKGNAYERDAMAVASDLERAREIKRQIATAKMLELDRLEDSAGQITLSKIQKPILSEIKSRRQEIQKDFDRIEKQSEDKFKSEIKSATTIPAVQSILDKAERDTIPKTFNKINDAGQRKIKEIRRDEAKERERQLKEAKIERMKKEKEERELEKQRKAEEYQERRAEVNRRREEREAEIAREKERRAEEELREIREMEMQLNLQEQQ